MGMMNNFIICIFTLNSYFRSAHKSIPFLAFYFENNENVQRVRQVILPTDNLKSTLKIIRTNLFMHE